MKATLRRISHYIYEQTPNMRATARALAPTKYFVAFGILISFPEELFHIVLILILAWVIHKERSWIMRYTNEN